MYFLFLLRSIPIYIFLPLIILMIFIAICVYKWEKNFNKKWMITDEGQLGALKEFLQRKKGVIDG